MIVSSKPVLSLPYEWGSSAASDVAITGIGCRLEPVDACRSDNTMGLPENTDCWVNDTHKLIVGATMPEDYNCRISLDAYFSGASEDFEDILVSVNGVSRVFEDDGREAGISEIAMPNKFPFVEGANEVIISSPMFHQECVNDTSHEDGQYESGELNLGRIRIYDCTERDGPVIDYIGIYPQNPTADDKIELYGDYSSRSGVLVQRIVRCYRHRGLEKDLVEDCSVCEAGADLYFSCNVSARDTSEDDIFTCYITVYDKNGMKDEDSITFQIGKGRLNSPPLVDILMPAEGTYFNIGRNVQCKGIATDDVDALGEEDLRWSYIFRGTEKTFENKSERVFAESWANFTVARTGIYTIRLTATDSEGASGYDTVTIHAYNPLSFVYIPIENLDMIVGTPEFIKETLINDKPTDDVFDLQLEGYQRAEFMTEGLDTLESVSLDKRSVSVRMNPFSSINIFVKVFADDLGVFVLNQTSYSQSEWIKHSIKITSGYPPDFPEGGFFFVIALITLAVVVFGLFIRK
ncbi:MAG: PKD domain-containing protein [Candidatus Aenigmarchaeota archaeon]|nr:PKD domain-containing protein [Candidatus Aenigmarchaeota archaeon]